MDEEFLDEIYKEMIAEEKEHERKWTQAKSGIDGLIHPKYFDFVEDNDGYCSNGVVEIELTDQKQRGYKNQCCKIKDERFSHLYMHHSAKLETLSGASDFEGDKIEYWVWQITGPLGDDFSGSLLLPLLDGKRFWHVSYSC